MTEDLEACEEMCQHLLNRIKTREQERDEALVLVWALREALNAIFTEAKLPPGQKWVIREMAEQALALTPPAALEELVARVRGEERERCYQKAKWFYDRHGYFADNDSDDMANTASAATAGGIMDAIREAADED